MIQSAGSNTAATRAKHSGSWRANQRSFVMVKAAVGTVPTRSAQTPRRQTLDELIRLGCGGGVVPQLGRPNDLPPCVERHEPMALSGHAQRSHLRQVELLAPPLAAPSTRPRGAARSPEAWWAGAAPGRWRRCGRHPRPAGRWCTTGWRYRPQQQASCSAPARQRRLDGRTSAVYLKRVRGAFRSGFPRCTSYFYPVPSPPEGLLEAASSRAARWPTAPPGCANNTLFRV